MVNFEQIDKVFNWVVLLKLCFKFVAMVYIIAY